MDKQITIREAITESDVMLFWEQLHRYYKRDIFPNSKNEEKEYFLGREYWLTIQKIHDRPKDRCYYLFFQHDGHDIGFAMPVIYTTEGGKCFIMEYCVYPEYRGSGTGRKCAELLLSWARKNGARYWELNCGGDEGRLRFWKSVGFVENGVDEWGEPLMLLPSEDEMPLTVEILNVPNDWQLLRLENGFKKDIGEELLTEEKQKQLQQAIKKGKITFFIAKRGYRAVGMCSVAKCFSTFSCSDVGVYDDFYIEPAFRKNGIARKLAQAAQGWCKENEIASLTVACAPSDEKMYQALGFTMLLGATFAHLT